MSLNFDIGGNVSGAVDGLKRVSKELQIVAIGAEKFGLKLQNLTQKVSYFGGGVRSFASNFTRVTPAIDDAGNALRRYTTSSNAAMQTSINFGRVIQDAPFGFLGIANNINPLLESYQRLRVETGSASGAFKQLGQSLKGAGGLGLALSVASSALIVFGDELFGASQSINKADVAINKFKNSIKELGDEIDGIKDRLDFSAEIRKLQFTLNNGAGAGANIFGLNIDSRNAGKLIEEIDKRITQLGNTVVKFGPQVKKFSDGIQNIPDKFLTRGQILLKTYGDISKIPEDQLSKLKATERIFISEYNSATKEIAELEKLRTEANRLIGVNAIKIQQEQKDELERLRKEDLDAYKEYVNKTIAKGKEIASFFKNIAVVPTFNVLDSTEEQLEKALKVIQDYTNANFTITVPLRVDPNSVEAPPNREFASATFEQMFGRAPVSTDPTDFSLLNVLRDWADIESAKTEAERMAQQIGSTIKNAVSESLGGVGNAIGETLSGGDVRSAFQAFAQTIGSALQAIGKQLIAIGTAALLAKEALKKLFSNPAVAIAAGVALVAAGAAMKNVLSKGLSGRATGGGVAANTPYVVGEGGRPEIFMPSTSGRIIPNNALNGLAGQAAQMIEVLITGRWSGDDLVLAVEKTIKKQGRY